MNNYISMVIAILEHSKVLTEDEAKKLSKELTESALPDNYKACSRLLKDIYDKLDIKTIEQKLKK